MLRDSREKECSV